MVGADKFGSVRRRGPDGPQRLEMKQPSQRKPAADDDERDRITPCIPCAADLFHEGKPYGLHCFVGEQKRQEGCNWEDQVAEKSQASGSIRDLLEGSGGHQPQENHDQTIGGQPDNVGAAESQ